MAAAQRNNVIDLLRFIAAVSVAIFHFYALPFTKPDNWYTRIFSYGHLGVPMFFTISGYCILIALKHAKKPTEFIIRRFFRIFPPYWFSLLITGSAILFFKLINGTNSISTIPKSITEIFATISLLTEPVTSVKTINWVYWTLTYEVFFYVVIYIASYFKGAYFTVFLILFTALCCLLPISDKGFSSYLKYWPLFCLGASLYKILHSDKKEQILNFLLLGSALAGCYYTHQTFIFCIASGVTLLLILLGHYKPLRNNKLSRLGDFSYSIYLIHVPIGVYCFGSLRNIKLIEGSGIMNFILDALLISLIVYLSGLMHKYVEIPFINYGKKLTAKVKPV